MSIHVNSTIGSEVRVFDENHVVGKMGVSGNVVVEEMVFVVLIEPAEKCESGFTNFRGVRK